MFDLKVLSLFDGMSCGMLALEKAGIQVSEYYASEIKKHAIKVVKDNYKDVIQIGDVTKVRFEDGIIYSENGNFDVGDIDMVIGGSPCQNFSVACIKEKRLGLNGEKSKLFYEFLRILGEVKPKYFLLENVSSMDKESRKELDEYMGVKSFEINTLSFLPQNRKRLFWTNIEIQAIKGSKSLVLNDILSDGYYSPMEYSTCLLEGHSRPNSDKLRLVRRFIEKKFIPVVFKSKEDYEEMLKHYNENYRGLSAKEVEAKRYNIDNSVYDCARVLNSKEMEILQGVTEGYTKSISRDEAASLLGDGWTVDVIAHIFKGLKGDF